MQTEAQQPVPAEVSESVPTSTSASVGDDLFTQALNAAVAAMPEPVETSKEPEKAPEPVKTEAAAPETKEEGKKEAEDPAVVRLYNLMERESALVERETKLKSVEAELESYKSKQKEYEQARNRLLYDPAALIKSLLPENSDMSLSDIAKALWMEDLGEKAPEDYRLNKGLKQAKTEIERLREELEAKEKKREEEARSREQAAAYDQYVGSMSAYVKQASDAYPLVKALAQANPDGAVRAMLEKAEKAAQIEGVVLTPEQCAKAIQEELEVFQRILVPKTETAEPAARPAPAPNTLRNKHQTIQQNREQTDISDREARLQAAIKAAEASLPA